jgi:hypothetical protein
MTISGSCFRLISAIAACGLGALTVDAAEIRADPRVPSFKVILEGRIEAGDFDKLRSFVFDDERGKGLFEIYLASPGGDLAEAMKIGLLVRSLKWGTSIPSKSITPEISKMEAARNGVKNFNNNMCASACFFVFVAGIERGLAPWEPILGIHRPYLSESDLKALSSENAIATANRIRVTIENYFREMSVPAKYLDQMFSIPKDEVRWISEKEYEADFEGFIPELRDWVDARCDNRTDVEKKISKELKHKAPAKYTPAEWSIWKMLQEKSHQQIDCEVDIQMDLASEAYMRVVHNLPARQPGAAVK